jgi:hypothetical protein
MKISDIDLYEEAWLGLDKSDLQVLKHAENPLTINNQDKFYEDNPGLYEFSLMRDPNYLHFGAKTLFGVELLPEQCAILKELWTRPFPMFVASRGFGKATGLDEVVHTPEGSKRMGDMSIGDSIYARDGEVYNVTGVHFQGKKQVFKVHFADGRSIECCEEHLWSVIDKGQKGKAKTLSTKQMFQNKLKIGNGSFYYRYHIPNCQPIKYEEKNLPLDPYILGCLLGDGTLKVSTPRISSDDQFIIDEFRDRLDGFELHRDCTNNNYTIVDMNKSTVEIERGGVTYLAKIKNRLTSVIKDLKLNVRTEHKFIPQIYKLGSVNQRMELIRGLLDTDGSINADGAIEFTNTCKQLIDGVIDVLRSLGIRCQLGIDDRSGQFQKMPQGTIRERTPCYRIFINTSQPIFKLPRKLSRIKKESTNAEKYVPIMSIEKLDKFIDMQCISVDSPDHTYITTDYIVTHNSWLLALYAMLKCALIPETKVVIIGAAFRQSKVIFEYMEQLWRNGAICRSIFKGNRDGPRRDTDRCTMTLGDSWAIAVPLGDGTKIRGLRAHTILCDEFASVPPDIYEVVVQGFIAVSASPQENVKQYARREAMKEKGIWSVYEERKYQEGRGQNQMILSGTADFDFKHFADYWKKYRNIVNSKGDMEKFRAQFDDEDKLSDFFDYRDFSVIRIPYEIIPKGFMDDKVIARAKATVDTGVYLKEYGACFVKDSNGFFKRSLIESCVTSDKEPVNILGHKIWFDAHIRGNSNLRYVYGIDPAADLDNFAIVVLELHNTHTRIVYSWTTNKDDFKRRARKGLAKEGDYFSFCIRKIRDLMKVFPCEHMAMDAQGGGTLIMEGLHDIDKIEEGELPIWEIIDPEKEKDTDIEPGLHILEMIQFAKYDWVRDANHGMRKDFEDKILLFPRFDPLSLELANASDSLKIKAFEKANPGQTLTIYDSLEDCVMEIEELKDELTTIVVTQTGTGVQSRDRWDTPESTSRDGKKIRLRKDRYSALLMANMAARQIHRAPPPVEYEVVGGFVSQVDKNQKGDMYRGPEWFTKGMNNLRDFGKIVRR